MTCSQGRLFNPFLGLDTTSKRARREQNGFFLWTRVSTRPGHGGHTDGMCIYTNISSHCPRFPSRWNASRTIHRFGRRSSGYLAIWSVSRHCRHVECAIESATGHRRLDVQLQQAETRFIVSQMVFAEREPANRAFWACASGAGERRGMQWWEGSFGVGPSLFHAIGGEQTTLPAANKQLYRRRTDNSIGQLIDACTHLSLSPTTLDM